MTRRGAWTLPAALLGAAGLAWWLSVNRMKGMDAGPSGTLGGLGWFTATWVLMMTAMMLPATWSALDAGRAKGSARVAWWRQVLASVVTVAAYLGVWTLAGALAYLALRTGQSLAGGTFEWHRAGRWLCVAVIVAAAAYQLTALKARWLTRCHAPAIGTGGTVTDGARAGVHAGRRCVASSWAQMAVLFALGAMSLVWMAVLAGLIALERIAPVRWWSRDGRPMSIRIGSTALLLALAVALAARPASVPGFTVPGSTAARHAMTRMSGMPVSGTHGAHKSATDMANHAMGPQRPSP